MPVAELLVFFGIVEGPAPVVPGVFLEKNGPARCGFQGQPLSRRNLGQNPGMVCFGYGVDVTIDVADLNLGREALGSDHVPDVAGHVHANEPVLQGVGMVFVVVGSERRQDFDLLSVEVGGVSGGCLLAFGPVIGHPAGLLRGIFGRLLGVVAEAASYRLWQLIEGHLAEASPFRALLAK